MTRTARTTFGAATALALLAAAGCSSGGSSSGGGYGAEASSPDPATSKAAKPSSANGAAPAPGSTAGSLSVADSSAGKVVVDGKGMVVYVFDKDTKGAKASACKGPCLAKWPVVHGTPETVKAKGVKGTLGSIRGADGKPQLTLNGLPLYYFVKDKAAGEAKGQGAMKVWWVVGANGTKIAK
jgi:predicted lipoprotein with Yx(FWY)xxD motif